MNRSKKHLKFSYYKYIIGIIRKHGINLDIETKKRLNSRDKKHVKYLLNTLYGYELDFAEHLDTCKHCRHFDKEELKCDKIHHCDCDCPECSPESYV